MSDTLLSVRDLKVRFPVKRASVFDTRRYLYAVDGVSFDVKRGETLAIVGESGSGKTTTALAIARLVESYSGTVSLSGEDMLTLDGDGLRAARSRFQFIFQDPYSSLNPRLRAGDVVAEPLKSLKNMTSAEQTPLIDELFAAVGLRKEQQR
ncbi:MAG: ATP-binding cassette domain-containing protein, partial [Pseudomonadota bacterium]